MSTFVMVADQARARLFQLDIDSGELNELEGFSNINAKLPDRELVSDAPGRASAAKGNYSVPMGTENQAHVHGWEVFAKVLVTEMEKRLSSSPSVQFYVIAGPRFLGVLRKKYTEQVKKHVLGELAKEITAATPAQIKDYLRGM